VSLLTQTFASHLIFRLAVFRKNLLRRLRLSSPEAAHGTLAELDRVVERAQSFDDFFSRPEWIEDYYRALCDYFGAERFPRRSFDAVCAQLREVAQQIPSLKKKIWGPAPSIEEFSISTSVQSEGRSLDLHLWRLFWFQRLSQLKKMAGGAGRGDEDLRFRRRLELEIPALVRGLNQKVAFFEAALKHGRRGRISKKEERSLRGEFFRKMRSDPAIKKAAAGLLYLYLSAKERQCFLQLADADVILYFFKDLRQNLKNVLGAIPQLKCPSGLLSEIKLLVPDHHELLGNLSLFPHRIARNNQGQEVRVGRTSAAEFCTLPIRPIHALWLGIPSSDCLVANAEMITPLRWALSAVSGCLSVVLEKDGIYQGYVRCVPICDERQKVYASLEIWAPLMVKNVIVRSGRESVSSLKVTSFFDAWLSAFCKVAPKHWNGLVLSESRLADNTGIKSFITESRYFQEGAILGKSGDFHISDPIALPLCLKFGRDEISTKYGEGFIFDGQISDAGNLRRLSDGPFGRA
jgi:hypothetical protein